MSKETIEAKALAHRRWLGFNDCQGIDPMTAIVKLKTRASKRHFNYEVKRGSEQPLHPAHWDYDRGVLVLSKDTFQGMNQHQARDMFTFAHEVGHILLDHQAKLHRAPAEDQGGKHSKLIQSLEYQANVYAAAFLIPDTPEVRSYSIDEICRRYFVSRKTAEIWLDGRT
ncbi:MAG: ImmA/IrrE family metallo-endopeptidase [Hyphomicrobiales bacterium]